MSSMLCGLQERSLLYLSGLRQHGLYACLNSRRVSGTDATFKA